jgi:ferredoxin
VSKFKVEIDKTACQGYGACIERCSAFFRFSEIDWKASFVVKGAKQVIKGNAVVAETLELENLECVTNAAAACPNNAIRIIVLKTREKLI